MAERRIPIQIDIVGTGVTTPEALADAKRQYRAIVRAFCAQYEFPGTALDESGEPTAEAIAFTKARLKLHIREVVHGWQRRKAELDALDALQLENLTTE